ncbi:MAG: glycosyltransferase family 1 protein [Planctomycetota bacterium]|nr:MAG: glycosyltransferase family 1 protein [Planctomycetota bacterium]
MTEDVHPRVMLLGRTFEVRGTCTYTLELAESLPAAGFDVWTVCPNADRLDRSLHEPLHVHVVPYLDSPVIWRVVANGLVHDFAANPPDLVHVQSHAMAHVGVYLAEHWRRPYVVTLHDAPRARERLTLHPLWGRHVIAVSDWVRQTWAGAIEPAQVPCSVIHTGVVLPEFSTEGDLLDPGRRPVIGTAGALEPQKGVAYLLQAARIVLRQGHDVEFLIAGSGPEESSLWQLARSLGIQEHVSFAPELYTFDVAIRAMDIFCLPALRQGLGTVMLQAMATGRPVIATDVGGVSKIVQPGRTGWLVPPGDAQALADAMLSLLSDPAGARSMGAAARAYVAAHFSVGEMVQRTAEVYRRVLAESPTAVTY